ncbi:MAG: Rieske (2Fe-2S) protein [Actinobacteria bacterium]|nr:Rieske (2Fe-2S) protein [Actinomycetota bacterium]
MPDYILCRTDQLVEGRGRPARAGERYLAVFLVDGEVHVLDNQCLHAASPIDGGPVVDGAVRCPWHGWSYDLRTGELLTGFGPRPGLATYPCRLEDGVVQVTIDDPVGN